MYIGKKILGITTAAALAAGSIAIAPVATAAPTAFAANSDKVVTQAMKTVEKHAKRSTSASLRAESACVKISGLSETDKKRSRLVKQAVTLIASAYTNYDSAQNLFGNTEVDYANAKQAKAAMKAEGFLDTAGAAFNVAAATCSTIPEVDEALNGGPVEGAVYAAVSSDSTVIRAMRSAERSAKQAISLANKASGMCTKALPLDLRDKKRVRYVGSAAKLLTAGADKFRAGWETYDSVEVDYNSAKQVIAVDRALAQLENAETTLLGALDNCLMLSDFGDLWNGVPK